MVAGAVKGAVLSWKLNLKKTHLWALKGFGLCGLSHQTHPGSRHSLTEAQPIPRPVSLLLAEMLVSVFGISGWSVLLSRPKTYDTFWVSGRTFDNFKVNWVLVKGFNLSHHDKETIIFSIDPDYGNLN